MLFSLNPYTVDSCQTRNTGNRRTLLACSSTASKGQAGQSLAVVYGRAIHHQPKSHLHHCCRLNWHANAHWLHRRPVCRRVFPNGTLEINAHGFTSCAVRCKLQAARRKSYASVLYRETRKEGGFGSFASSEDDRNILLGCTYLFVFFSQRPRRWQRKSLWCVADARRHDLET